VGNSTAPNGARRSGGYARGARAHQGALRPRRTVASTSVRYDATSYCLGQRGGLVLEGEDPSHASTAHLRFYSTGRLSRFGACNRLDRTASILPTARRTAQADFGSHATGRLCVLLAWAWNWLVFRPASTANASTPSSGGDRRRERTFSRRTDRIPARPPFIGGTRVFADARAPPPMRLERRATGKSGSGAFRRRVQPVVVSRGRGASLLIGVLPRLWDGAPVR